MFVIAEKSYTAKNAFPLLKHHLIAQNLALRGQMFCGQ